MLNSNVKIIVKIVSGHYLGYYLSQSLHISDIHWSLLVDDSYYTPVTKFFFWGGGYVEVTRWVVGRLGQDPLHFPFWSISQAH
jgi:hypothetical protein